ncbi:MAG: RNA pyrophosphohydrolase [Alphaproteobacteria bacterium]|nr:RNA pyrophosphohydrolase [Alphaproteobacteria bacterium]
MTAKKYRPNVGLMISNRAGQVLMCERVDTPGAFQMPQGGIDAGETPAQAAWRELHEEVGLTRSEVRLIAESGKWRRYDFVGAGQHHLGWAGQTQKWFLFLLTDDAAPIDFHRQAAAEFQSHQWMTPAQAIRAIWEIRRPIYRAVFDEFKPFFASLPAIK